MPDSKGALSAADKDQTGAGTGALPTFFVVGALKAGTTSLHSYLEHVPGIHMSRVKETNYFLDPTPGLAFKRVASLREYEGLFCSDAPVRGESSPSYTFYPLLRGVPERIAALVPDAKLIYVVRNPTDRIVSHFVHNAATKGIRGSFAEHAGDLSDADNRYIFPSLYWMQLQRYLKAFDASQILVIDNEDLLHDRLTTLGEVCRFLDVDDRCYSPAFDAEHLKGGDRRRVPPRLGMIRNRAGASPLRFIPSSVRRPLRQAVERALWPAVDIPVLTDAQRQDIRRACGPDVARLREFTGKAFPTWDV
ncbi:MAG TPA: sulfotransferase [Solirubrobacteraceae bacterium]|jgi:hypothetical protein|nr:sulfotransferase [Solirubrobacteraceae bacterium]